MKVLIISTNQSSQPVPVMPAGACHAAETAIRAGHDARLLDLMFERRPARAVEAEVRAYRPDVVGLSVRNIDNGEMLQPVFFVDELGPLMRAIRACSDAPVVIGGAAASVMTEGLLRRTGATCAVVADSRSVFPALLDALSSGETFNNTPGVAWIEDGAFMANPPPIGFSDLSMAPDYPRWINTGAYLRSFSTVPVQSKLGCHFKCIYCTYRNIEGEQYRLYTPESVAATVARLSADGLREIEFVDNLFNYPYSHAMEICEGLARAGHKARLQSIEMTPLHIDDALLTAMERAGFVGMGITAESASDTVLKGLMKGFGADDVRRAAEVVRRHRLPCLWIFMLGGPGETPETVRETLDFAARFIRPSDAAFFNIGIRIYPGTGLESLARRQGLLSLPPEEMLKPVFYVSPEVDADWMTQEVNAAIKSRMNFMHSGSIGLSSRSAISRLGYRLGVRPPIWRYARFIRRAYSLIGH